jgi:hypothetical protein
MVQPHSCHCPSLLTVHPAPSRFAQSVDSLEWIAEETHPKDHNRVAPRVFREFYRHTRERRRILGNIDATLILVRRSSLWNSPALSKPLCQRSNLIDPHHLAIHGG